MNKLRSLIFVPLRHYQRGGRNSRNSRFQRVEQTERQLYGDADIDDVNEDDFDDVERDEADFTGANKTYREYIKEQREEKEKLKTRIIKRKYFKNEDPNFITWSERAQIQELHARDSKEWSPERLSESFPALPDTIRRLLRAKWQPRSANVVLKYDNQVIENWEKFKTGSIAVSPQLSEHLEKFKGRKIEATDLQRIAEKFVQQPVVFPEPQANLFKGIITSYIEDKKNNVLQIEAPNEKKKQNLFAYVPKTTPGRRMDFETFVENTIDKKASQENNELETELLIKEYQKIKENKELEESAKREIPKNQQIDAGSSSLRWEKGTFGDEWSQPFLMSKSFGHSERDRKDFEKIENSRKLKELEQKAKSDDFIDNLKSFDYSDDSVKTENLENSVKMENFENLEDPVKMENFENPEDLENSVKLENSENSEKLQNDDALSEIDSKIEMEKSEKPKLPLNEKAFREKFKSEIQLQNQPQNAVGEVTPTNLKVKYVDVPKLNLEEDKLATGIVEWKKIEVTGRADYPAFIKIPQGKSRKWKTTYRVEDRYYDCDGEFLYRVPGLKE